MDPQSASRPVDLAHRHRAQQRQYWRDGSRGLQGASAIRHQLHRLFFDARDDDSRGFGPVCRRTSRNFCPESWIGSRGLVPAFAAARAVQPVWVSRRLATDGTPPGYPLGIRALKKGQRLLAGARVQTEPTAILAKRDAADAVGGALPAVFHGTVGE